MKLVDILAQELKDWPHDSLGAKQHKNGWVSMDMVQCEPCGTVKSFAMSEDQSTAIVTRTEWQAAVDALNAKEIIYSSENVSINADCISITESGSDPECKIVSKDWGGDGLPPAGTICELQHMSWDADRWEKREILYAGSRYLVTTDPDSAGEIGSYIWEVQFRPILTAEQVAAEEREKAIKDMMEVTSDGISCIGQDDALALYKAGYRKEPKPCGS